MTFIQVRHNIEVAHRLSELPGKCEAIHGHSMWVELRLHGQVDGHGLLDGLEFGAVKKEFRQYLDTNYDHRLLLNEKDDFAKELVFEDSSGVEWKTRLPGLTTFAGDPTTENLARWIAQWASTKFEHYADVVVHETAVNAASYSARPGSNGG